MKAIFMGTPDFSLGALESLVEEGHTVSCVVTQPDKPKGRSGKPVCSPVKEYALQHGLTVFQPEKVRTEESISQLAEYGPDIIVVSAFGQILPKEILDLPRFGCINVHASLLPRYRGASPIQEAILQGDSVTGVTIMQMDEGLDTGDILLQKELPIFPEDTAGTLFDKLCSLGKEALKEALKGIEAGEITPIPQDNALATKTGMIKKSFGEIRFSAEASEILKMIRAYDPWPGAYTGFRGKQLKLWKAEALPDNTQGKPGEIIEVEKDSFLVACGTGALRILELQLTGKRRMSTRDFLAGTKLVAGEILGY